MEVLQTSALPLGYVAVPTITDCSTFFPKLHPPGKNFLVIGNWVINLPLLPTPLLIHCNLSPVTYHLSPITCHLSPATCHLSPVTYLREFHLISKVTPTDKVKWTSDRTPNMLICVGISTSIAADEFFAINFKITI